MTHPTLLRSASVLQVTNRTMKPTRDFFVEKLGFSIGTEMGKGPVFVTLDRNDQTIMLSCTRVFGRVPKGWAAYFWVDDVAATRRVLLAWHAPQARTP